MHGVSDHVATKAFEIFGFPSFIPVKEQQAPDPEFPTVRFPNPEENGAPTQSTCYLVCNDTLSFQGLWCVLSILESKHFECLRSHRILQSVQPIESKLRMYLLRTQMATVSPLQKRGKRLWIFLLTRSLIRALGRSSGEWTSFTGDQLGTLFASRTLEIYKLSGKPLSKITSFHDNSVHA